MSNHTPGPWMLATGCSWRRILTERGDPVIVPTNHPIDNHPDLSGRDEDMELAARAPELLAELESATLEIGELQKLKDLVYRYIDRLNDPAECDLLHDIVAEFVADFERIHSVPTKDSRGTSARELIDAGKDPKVRGAVDPTGGRLGKVKPQPEQDKNCTACGGTGMLCEDGTEEFCPYCDSTGREPEKESHDA